MTQIHLNTFALRGHYAGFVSRAVAIIIDLILVVLVQILVIVIVRLIFNFLGINALLDFLGDYIPLSRDGIATPLATVLTWVGTFLGGMILFGLYVAIAWTLIDKTIGQALLGLRVLRTNGDHLTFRKAIRRAVGLVLAALPLFFGFLWVLIDDRRQGWHDKFADTVVVYDWDARLGAKLRDWITRQQGHLQAQTVEPIEPPLTGAQPPVDTGPAPDRQATPSQQG